MKMKTKNKSSEYYRDKFLNRPGKINLFELSISENF